jgi:hypothetical protein
VFPDMKERTEASHQNFFLQTAQGSVSVEAAQ